MSKIVVLDIEASGLSEDSYPIEIGWVDLDGQRCDTFLIRPEPGWTYWDPIAEETIHGISKTELQGQGISAQEAATRLSHRLTGCRVIVDAVEWDQFWMKRLFSSSTVNCDFQFCSVGDVLPEKWWEHAHLHRALADAACLRALVAQSLNATH